MTLMRRRRGKEKVLTAADKLKNSRNRVRLHVFVCVCVCGVCLEVLGHTKILIIQTRMMKSDGGVVG